LKISDRLFSVGTKYPVNTTSIETKLAQPPLQLFDVITGDQVPRGKCKHSITELPTSFF
jgi:hypothetical protein